MLKVLLVAIISSGIWLIIVRCYDREQKRPMKFLLWAGLMGGAFSTEAAGIFNTIFSELTGIAIENAQSKPFSSLFHAYYVGFNEEFWKILAAVLILKWNRHEVKHPLDILTLGISVSMGFEMIENISYGYHFTWDLVLWRSLLPGHLLYGAVWSFGLKEYYSSGKNKSGIQYLILIWLLSAALHATYDFFIFLDEGWAIIVAIILTWAPLVIIHRKLRQTGSQQLSSGFSLYTTPSSVSSKGLYSSTGRHPAVLAKAFYLAPETLKKLDSLRLRQKQKRGVFNSRKDFIHRAIESLHRLHEKRGTIIEPKYFSRQENKNDYFSLNGSNCLNLSFSSIKMLDDIRHQTKKQTGLQYSRDTYLVGFINKMYNSRSKQAVKRSGRSA